MSSKIAFIEQASKPDANVAELCREHGISRQTGHKWLKRFRARGYEGLEEDSRRPKSAPLATGEEVVAALLTVKAAHPRWGPRKLVRVLRRQFGSATPSERTVARVLERFGQVRHRRRRRRELSVVERAPQVTAKESNEVWTIDFKGWWRASDGTRCDPLTVRDAHSRFVLALELLPSPTGPEVRRVLTRLFRRYGTPKAIQCDNGTPFICTRSRAGLTHLSVWWISLGIRIVRSRPGCPQDNGGHERMHRDVAAELQSVPEATMALQQRACDRWRQEFNHVRPHDALDGRTPTEVYKPSRGSLTIRPAIYPPGWVVRRVKPNGVIGDPKDGHFISTAVASCFVGLEPLGGLRHKVWFYDVDLGEVELAPSLRMLSRLAS